MRKIKAIVYGVGAMGRIMTRLMLEKGVNVVGAIDVNPDVVGKDLGEVAGLDHPLNVKISDNADAVLSEQAADIALIAAFTELERMFPLIKRCVENGVNVITTSEEAFYSWTTSPVLTAKLDKLARKHGVTVTGGGYQDGFLVNLVTVLTGASHTIESVAGREKFNVDDYGPVVAEYHHVGQTKEEFDTWLREQGPEPSYFRMNLECLIADLGLTVKRVGQTVEPTIDNVDIESKSIGKLVRSGEVTGTAEIVEFDTEQGIKFRGELVGKVYRPDEEDINQWHIKGVPELYLTNDKVPIRMTTCTQIVNRIPDVINAEPGFITVEKLPKLRYRAFPLEYYLKK